MKGIVTIDAEWFAELFATSNDADKVCEECVREKCGECKVVKERDELKAKLKDCYVKHQDALALANRLAAAERCIGKAFDGWAICIGEILRAYIEKKEAAHE